MTVKLEIDGREYTGPEIAIVAQPVAQARHPQGVPTYDEPCHHCGAMTRIDCRSRHLVDWHGLRVFCMSCALEVSPEMPCGTDPNDGHVVTLREAVDRGLIKTTPAPTTEDPPS